MNADSRNTDERHQAATLLGVDIGSVTISLVQMDLSGKILDTAYLFHKGQIRETLRNAEQQFDLSTVRSVACCTATCIHPDRVTIFNPQVAAIRAAKMLCGKARSLLLVGAERFMLFRFDEKGTFESIRSNSSCAAGTGSFLDQQAFRLNLSGIEELCAMALRNSEPIPDIASRCSVFAKTDLIHAQQQGYSPEAICDSLCKGLATNIVDTLFNQETPVPPIFFAGGVSKNAAVIRHLEKQLDTRFLQHQHSHLVGAIGACYLALDENPISSKGWPGSLEEILLPDDNGKAYFHPPLALKLSGYPDFRSEDSWNFKPVVSAHPVEVQVDLYAPLSKGIQYETFLGIDIGSTSTKAVITKEDQSLVAGFYTYTAGKPVDAVQAIFEAIDDLVLKQEISLKFIGAGTTGSGRKFIGKIIHADLIVDEITAHARAAYELNPETDTIIEIGGQDSKFTLMHDGMVTFSQMNAVCAAGTGSFIEEQARKLGCDLSDYSQRTDGVPAPLASDRCTVFMERDANQLLNKGYSVNEILATILHSVMENFLKKVAVEGSIGNHICFQGATAKNRSLVAAFEQRLGKKIFVSPYCHLSGALGVALLLREEIITESVFRGIQLYREKIRISTETCTICTNRCSISLATVHGEQEAYGFLCGRDYETKKYVTSDSQVFNLLEERSRILHVRQPKTVTGDVIIGLPAALHLFEELSLWKRFFANLSIRTLSSEHYIDPVRSGKRIAGAEFCAPIDSMYGHAAFLAEKTDYIFLPVSLEARDKNGTTDRNYCYYTQYSASLIHTLKDKQIPEKLLSPLLNFSKGNKHVIRQLVACLHPVLGSLITPLKVKQAYEEALLFTDLQKNKLFSLFKREFQPDSNISVILLGRPYVVLEKSLNKGIPDIFARMGIKTFSQDMISPDELLPGETELLLRQIPWYFAARVLETATVAATTKNLYPVLLTAFKCAPDSFITDYFKKILNHYRKPYLILQIDEHDSNVGYETRIEAAIRSFRNHASREQMFPGPGSLQLIPGLETKINGRTLLFPNWDNLVTPLLVANLKRGGIDARLMHSSDLTIKKSMASNTGQCLPVNIIAQEFIDYVEQHQLLPEQTMLWMTKSYISCNLRQYPFYIKNLLETYGHGFEKAAVYLGELTHLEIGINTGYNAYFAYLLGGLIRKVGCRIRPYEINRGETDKTIDKSIRILEEAFLGNRPMDDAVVEAISLFDKIGRKEGRKPGVAIFGDLYVRDNDIMNQDLIHTIEENGGEVITTPYTDLVKITIENVIRRAIIRGDYYRGGLFRVMLSAIKFFEDRYYKHFRKYLGNKPVVNPLRLEKHLAKFNITPFHSGESYENILKIFYILENYPDISLFVQTNPAFCCPALVTEAMTQEIKRITSIPVVTLTYDGTGGFKNDLIASYLKTATVS
ncbi:MAG: acyl-CoA dehydratase activase [Bacteroidetes bacterium]|nr:acyl-CoA dehydratase activase [Bacteroidota bacterium]